MYNLHSHSLLSDGALLPSEVACRHAALGYKAIAICDHVDYSNIQPVTDAILRFCRTWPKQSNIAVLPGIELTHLPLKHFYLLAKYARKKGIKVIVAHGESPVEPMTPGTNQAALEADIDILAHPGMISDSDVQLAKKKGIFLEVTSRHGHSQTNTQVIKQAIKQGAKLILNLDSHSPEDIIAPQAVIELAGECGLSLKQIDAIYKEVGAFLKGKGIKC